MTHADTLEKVHAPARPQPAMHCGARNPHYERWETIEESGGAPAPSPFCPPGCCAPPRHKAPTECRTKLHATPLVIGLSGFAGSGKSTVASILEEKHGFVRIRFAGPLKDMLRQIGLTDYELEGDGKEVPNAILQGKTPRYAMQTLGTEWGRDLVGPLFWSKVWEQSVIASLREGARGIVVDDLRFPNELETLKDLGGWHVRLIRSRGTDAMTLAAHAHPSERALANAHPDSWLQNTGTVADLEERVGLTLLQVAQQQEHRLDALL